MDFIQFNEGSDYIDRYGWPNPVWFFLSHARVNDLTTASTLSSGLQEINGSGYDRISQPLPDPVAGVLNFSTMSWLTNSAVNWPAAVHSIIAATTHDDSGVALCCWNLQPGGTPRSFAGSFITDNITPTYTN